MMDLFASDLTRFWSRRLMRVFPIVVGLLLVLLFAVITIIFVAVDEGGPTFNEIVYPPDELENIFDGVMWPLGMFLPLFGFILGSSFIGADLKSGVVESILTWESRRPQFMASRTAAGGLGAGALGLVFAVLIVGGYFTLSAVTGSIEGTTASTWGDIGVGLIRAAVVSALSYCLGLGLTILINSSLGAVIGYVIYWFVFEALLLSLLLPQSIEAFLPLKNAGSFLYGNSLRTDPGVWEFVRSGDNAELLNSRIHHGPWIAGIVFLAWAALFLGFGSWVFNRRDVG